MRPDGRIWLLHEQGHRRRLALDDSGGRTRSVRDGRAPAGRPYESWHFENEHGQRRARLRRHAGRLRWPVPGDDVRPRRPVLVRPGPLAARGRRRTSTLGFVVGLVNYRGSIGYGREWSDALVGNIGGPELEDVNAGLRDLVARGLADADRAVIAGYSWGGYVTLLEVGKHPKLWTCGVAGVPVGRLRGGVRGSARLSSRRTIAHCSAADSGGPARPDARSERDQLRRPRARPRPVPHRAQRLALPVRTGDGLRRQARRPRAPARGRRLRDWARVVRRRRGGARTWGSRSTFSAGTCRD